MALLPLEEALQRIIASAKLLPAETVPLHLAHGRILAKAITARADQPPFHASAMDGYAFRHADATTLPASLKIIGTAAAGHPFKGTLRSGQAVRILTGAPLPRGADTIVIQENTSVSRKTLQVIHPTEKGRNIRPHAMDFAKGLELVPAGQRLTARDVGLAASANHAFIRVRMKPRVAILTTGDELAVPGAKLRPGQIRSSNSPALAAYAAALGADVLDLGIIRDDLKAITAAVRKAARADILITTGGASVGDHDHVQEALRRAGVKIDFWKIAMRPGKPFMFGTRGRLRVLGLPGNPVAALVCARLFLKPLIAAMNGLPTAEPLAFARLSHALPANDQRQDYLRGELAADGTVVTAQKQDSSMQRVMRTATCLVIRPPHAPEAKPGELVPVLRLDDGL